jgi:hypothetical protein
MNGKAQQSQTVFCFICQRYLPNFLSAVGGGCPDAAVGRAGKTYFLEFKGGEYPSDRKLTDDQVEWHSTWEGHAAIVCNIDEALEAVGL